MGLFDFFKKKDDLDDLGLNLSNSNFNSTSQQNLNVPQDSTQNSSLPDFSDFTNPSTLTPSSAPNPSPNTLSSFQSSQLESQAQQSDPYNPQLHSFQHSTVSSVNDFNRLENQNSFSSQHSPQNQYQNQHLSINDSNVEIIKKDMQLILEKLNTLKIMLDGMDARLRKLEQIAENEQKKPRYF